MASTAPQPTRVDPVHADPKHYKVELENDSVRIVRITYGPGEKSVMHGHPASAVVFLGDANFRFTFPDGKVEEGTVSAGQVMYMDAVEHLPENIGTKPFEVVQIELKK